MFTVATEAGRYYGVCILIPQGCKICTQNKDKIIHGQKKIDTKCNNYTPHMSHRAIRNMQFMHTDLLCNILSMLSLGKALVQAIMTWKWAKSINLSLVIPQYLHREVSLESLHQIWMRTNPSRAKKNPSIFHTCQTDGHIVYDIIRKTSSIVTLLLTDIDSAISTSRSFRLKMAVAKE